MDIASVGLSFCACLMPLMRDRERGERRGDVGRPPGGSVRRMGARDAGSAHGMAAVSDARHRAPPSFVAWNARRRCQAWAGRSMTEDRARRASCCVAFALQRRSPAFVPALRPQRFVSAHGRRSVGEPMASVRRRAERPSSGRSDGTAPVVVPHQACMPAPGASAARPCRAHRHAIVCAGDDADRDVSLASRGVRVAERRRVPADTTSDRPRQTREPPGRSMQRSDDDGASASSADRLAAPAIMGDHVPGCMLTAHDGERSASSAGGSSIRGGMDAVHGAATHAHGTRRSTCMVEDGGRRSAPGNRVMMDAAGRRRPTPWR